MNKIFSKFHTEIYIIQKHLRRKLSNMKTKKIKPGFLIQTYTIKGILFTLAFNK